MLTLLYTIPLNGPSPNIPPYAAVVSAEKLYRILASAGPPASYVATSVASTTAAGALLETLMLYAALAVPDTPDMLLPLLFPTAAVTALIRVTPKPTTGLLLNRSPPVTTTRSVAPAVHVIPDPSCDPCGPIVP